MSAAAVAAALIVGGTLAVQSLGSNDSPPAGTTTPLVGTVWQLLGYGSERNPSSSATFYIGSDGQLVADDACTVISADANVAGGRLSPTDLQVRPRSCVDSNAPTFTTGVDILTAGPTYSIDGDQLVVSDGHTAMHLKSLPGAVPPTSDVPTLTETQWHLGEAISPNGDVTVGRGEAFTISNGRLKASDGCNTITADAAQDGNRVDLKQVKNTRLPCPSNGVDPIIDNVLSGGSLVQVVEGGVLTVSKKGAGTLIYAWAPADKQATNPSALTGPTWRIGGVAGHQAVGSATLHITGGGHYVVNDGCSQYSGTADVEHGTIRLRGVPKTPTCQGAAGNQATTIDSYLGVRTLWSVRGGDLVIDGGSAQANSLVFTNGVPSSAPTGSTAALDGTTWQLTGASTGNGPPLLVSKDAVIRLGFVNSGKIDYDDGGNQYQGSVAIGADTLRITDLSGTLAGCTQSAACTQAGVIDGVLSGTPTWSITGDQLTVTKAGAGKLVYELTSSRTSSSAPPSSTSTPADPSVLYNKTWRLTGLEQDSGNSASGHSASAKVTLTFDSSGSFTLNYPCGSEMASITFESSSATVHPPMAVGSGRPCNTTDPTSNPDVAPVISVLAAGSLSWSVGGGTLTLSRSGETLTFSS